MAIGAIYTREEWTAEKSRLNHDLIKNRLLLDLSKAIGIAEGSVSNSHFARTGLKQISDVFQQIDTITTHLLQVYVRTSSPGSYFRREPLNHIDENIRVWLPDFLDVLWNESWKVDVLVLEAEKSLDTSRRALWEMLKDIEDNNAAISQDIHPQLKSFQQALIQLSVCLSTFPRSMWRRSA
jgi:hypothetical protein